MTNSSRTDFERFVDADTGAKVLEVLHEAHLKCKRVGLPDPPAITGERADELAKDRNLRAIWFWNLQLMWRRVLKTRGAKRGQDDNNDDNNDDHVTMDTTTTAAKSC
jgi:hypothetical protein